MHAQRSPTNQVENERGAELVHLHDPGCICIPGKDAKPSPNVALNADRIGKRIALISLLQGERSVVLKIGLAHRCQDDVNLPDRQLKVGVKGEINRLSVKGGIVEECRRPCFISSSVG